MYAYSQGHEADRETLAVDGVDAPLVSAVDSRRSRVAMADDISSSRGSPLDGGGAATTAEMGEPASAGAAPGDARPMSPRAEVASAPAAAHGSGDEVAVESLPSGGRPSISSAGGARPQEPAISSDAPGAGRLYRPTDPLVDYYMQTHWDSAEYAKLYAEIESEFGAGAMPERDIGPDRLPEPPTDSGGRMALQLGAALYDAAVWSVAKAIPVVGIVPTAITAFTTVTEAFFDYDDLAVEGGLDEWMLGLTVARTVLDLVGGVAGNLADTATIAQNLIHAGVIGTVGLGIPAEAVNAGIIAAGEASRLVSMSCDGVNAGLDRVLMLGNIALADRLEAEGNYEAAGTARALAAGNAVDAVVDGLSAALGLVEFMSLNHVGLLSATVDAVGDIGQATASVGKPAWGVVLESALTDPENAASVAGALGEGLTTSPALEQLGNDQLYRRGQGDAMLYSGAHIDGDPVASGGDVAGLIGPARAATLGGLQAAQGALAEDPPHWYQALINEFFITPPEAAVRGTLDELTSPTWYLTQQLGVLCSAGQLVWTTGRAATARLLPAVASRVREAEFTVADPMVQWLGDGKAHLDELLQAVGETLMHHTDWLDGVERGVGHARGFLEEVSRFADERGPLDDAADSLLERLSAARPDPASFQVGALSDALVARLGEYVPGIEGLVAGVLSAVGGLLPEGVLDRARGMVQAAIDGIVHRVDGLIGQMEARARAAVDEARARLDAFIDEQVTLADEMLAQLEEYLAEGGGGRALLEAQQQAVAQAVLDLAAGSAALGPDFGFDCGAAACWLDAVAEYLGRAQADEEQEQSEQAALYARWSEVMRETAAPYVVAWRTDHEAHVRTAYHPAVPAEELAAFEEAAEILSARLDRARPGGAHVDAFRAALIFIRMRAQSISGEGAASLEALWAAEDALITLDRQMAFVGI